MVTMVFRVFVKIFYMLRSCFGIPNHFIYYIYNFFCTVTENLKFLKEDIDDIFYSANMNKLIQLHRWRGDPVTIRHFSPFLGRHFKLESGEIIGSGDVVKIHCPALNQPTHASENDL